MSLRTRSNSIGFDGGALLPGVVQGDEVDGFRVHPPASEDPVPNRRSSSTLPQVEFADFRRLFEGSIRAQISWEKLETSKPEISVSVLSKATELGSMYTVWYTNSAGESSDWRDPTSMPQTVAEVVHAKKGWPDSRTTLVDYFRRQFSASPEPLLLMVPSYAVGDKILILDSSHRIAAAYCDRVNVRVLFLTIHGPIDFDILPDLPRMESRMQ